MAATHVRNEVLAALLDSPSVEESKTWLVADIPAELVKKEPSCYDDVKAKISQLKKKFHQDRKLLVKHLPRNVQESEVSEMLHEFQVEEINLSNNDEKSSTALVSLKVPERLEEWDDDANFLLRGHSVIVCPTPTEMLLCVARLPFHFTESDFLHLIREYGEIKMYFLMISERTGASKGYGFVQYASKEQALIARNALNDKVIESFQLVCDWVDSSHLTFSSLHSNCLYVDRLPSNFRDMSEFRAIFERIIKPPYCQIALKKGYPLDWGLVEYLKAEDAELAQTSCNNYRLRSQNIRVVYYIPGVRAINLMLSLLDSTPRGKSGGLLPDPTRHSVCLAIKNLSKQNPIFSENVKNIILNQIHEKQGEDMTQIGEKIGEPASIAVNDYEKIVPPTPPITPMSVIPIPGQSLPGGPCYEFKMGHNNSPAQTVPVSMIPNTAVPPPIMAAAENVGVAGFQQIISASLPYQPQLMTPDGASTSYSITPPGLIRDVMTLPLQSNMYHLIGTPAISIPAPIAAAPPPITVPQNMSSYPPSHPMDRYPPGVGTEVLIPTSQMQLTIPIASKGIAVAPLSLASITHLMTPNMSVLAHGATPPASTDWLPHRMPPSVVTALPSTPIIPHFIGGKKRKLLPSPEKSPEGDYIGQHSQGIGGHYADSYFKKKRMF